MSHAVSNTSQHPNNRTLWIPIASDDQIDITENQGQATPVVRDVSPLQNTDEHEGLLAAEEVASHRQSISSAPSRLSVNKEPRAVPSEKSSQLNLKESSSLRRRTWLPYTLRRFYLAPLAVLALVLAVVLAVLCAYSTHHYGLGTDNGSVGLFIARRYVPTIIAVLFTQAINMIAEDVKRTEVFARMAGPKPVAATYTLFYIPKVWWKSVYDGLSAKRNGGHRRWILSLSSLAAGISILVVSTFSSSVFVTKDVLYRTDAQLQRYTAQENGSIVLLPQRNTYTRTISGFLYNTSTSLWVSDSHVVLPFTTSTEDATRQSLPEGTWEAETKVLKLESNCVPMKLTEKSVLNITFTSTGSAGCNGTCVVKSRGLKLRSEDGCEIQLQTPIAPSVESSGSYVISNPIDGYMTDILALQGGMLWTNLSSDYVSWQNLIEEHGTDPPVDSSGDIVLDQWRRVFIYDLSDQCQNKDLLFISPPWFNERIVPAPADWQEDYWNNFTARVEICTPNYTQADIPVTAVIGGASPGVFFDDKRFKRDSKSVPKELIDMNRLNELAFGGSWFKYFPAPAGDSDLEGFEGVTMLLAKVFSLNTTDMLQNSSVPSQASRLRARFFGELISSSVLEANVPVAEDVAGESIKTESRVVVIPGVSIALAVLLFLAACYSSVMLWYASSHRRPLNLNSDPAALAGIVPLADITSPLAASLRTWTDNDRTSIQAQIGHQVFTIEAGKFTEHEKGAEKGPSRSTITSIAESRPRLHKRKSVKPIKPEWRPSMLRKKWLSLLLFGLIAITTTLLVLREFADKETLFQTAFVQQINLSLFHASFSPHSIIATLIAVTVGICWDNIDKSMRTLQTYLTMSKEPTEPSRGISISYQSSYWAWAAVKSARSKHWILCLVTIGTTLSQIFVISMAAVFERRTVIHTQSTQSMDVTTIRSQLPRQQPFKFSINLGQRPFHLSDTLLATSETDWLYNALDDITMDTPTIPWTADEWVFTPVNVTNRDDPTMLFIAPEARENDHNDATYGSSSFNISLTTSALRSRLECGPVALSEPEWLESVQDVYPNRFDKAVTGHVLPMTLSLDGGLSAPVFSAPRRMACCTNGTDHGNQTIVAYWSSDNKIYDEQPAISVDINESPDVNVPSEWSKGFTIKWIVGPAASTLIPGSESNFISNTILTANETVLYFVEEPRMSIMECTPAIEQANANITLARDTSQILSYELLEAPQPAVGAWDYAYDVVYSTPGSNTSEGNVSYGAFFISQLLTAPHIIESQVRSSMMVFNHTLENLAAERFAFRDTTAGLNMDYMSYANFILAKKDPTALLNYTILQQHSEQTFQAFFKRFATAASWNYGGPSSVSKAAYEELSAFDKEIEKFDGIVTERIEILSMNKVATWLSLAIIFLLIIILVILIVSLQVTYPSTSMLRRVECLADVLAMVAGSDELVRLIEDVGVESMEKNGINTRLGWFRDRRGVVRWGVEVVDADVEWVDRPEDMKDDRVENPTR